MHSLCVYILYNLLQKVLNFFGLAHNGLLTAAILLYWFVLTLIAMFM